MTAAVSTKAETSVVNGINGRLGVAEAQYVLKATATRSDGKVVMGVIGLASVAGTSGGQSQIILAADSIVMVPSSDPNAAPAQFLTLQSVNGVTTLAVPAARIGDLQVGTTALANDASTRLLGATVYYNTVAQVTLTITQADIPAGESTVQVLVLSSTDTAGANPFMDIGIFYGSQAFPPSPNFSVSGSLMSAQPPAGVSCMVHSVTLGVGVFVIACYNRGGGYSPTYDAYARQRTVAVVVKKK